MGAAAACCVNENSATALASKEQVMPSDSLTRNPWPWLATSSAVMATLVACSQPAQQPAADMPATATPPAEPASVPRDPVAPPSVLPPLPSPPSVAPPSFPPASAPPPWPASSPIR